MSATDLVLTAFAIGMKRDEGLHRKWISISHKLGPVAGTVHTVSLQRIGRLDMLLRVLEDERLERLKAGQSANLDLSLDLQLALSENWLFSSYEVARAAKKPFQANSNDASRLISLERRLALVRMPLAKGVIQGMDRNPHKQNPPMLASAGDNGPELYRDDGSYMMSHGICAGTGSALWSPVDITKGETIAICRRDLSDEMLALFD
ncbi:hypothetical protein EKJ_12160 [Qipengyuania flava]|uniref:Uncharacterized protein n=1 Tax=Qipengyuania flava TaxID=192812 RepID=A0A3T1CHA3_9SPHN|nr:hypothetical protein [Qipengyuania flava]BBI20369.1 hypothetical protein EKJ_12160 [Qipengyuania flava]